ncbi:MAG: phosphoribosylanthranilate isomerase [Tannerellaceae bacterium]|jgi:phosphoribosylanthranilate isomerase|nr:phosphoribosylanthranilate isomerase [Tannerellaceae bacterium]
MIIKVCGMCRPGNIRQLAALEIDWIGFIFWPGSGRQLPADKSLISLIHHPLKKVGVFVNAFAEEMMETAAAYELDYLQLHGEESPEVCHRLQKRGFTLIKAFSIATEDDLKRTREYEGRVEYFLFDTKCENYGGSGRSFDWSVLKAYKGATPFLLSGGINPHSLEAIRRFHHPCFRGIDLNSGFETEPGLKDIGKLTPFIRSLRANK